MTDYPQTAIRTIGRMLRNRDPQAVAALQELFDNHGGSLRAVAKKVGVSETTVHNWVRLPGVRINRRTRGDNWRNFTETDEEE